MTPTPQPVRRSTMIEPKIVTVDKLETWVGSAGCARDDSEIIELVIGGRHYVYYRANARLLHEALGRALNTG